jgi:L-seryl-tRNA(Ser) seleniumtransferase
MGFYENLGVKRIINACGTVTKISGSKMDKRVLDAMCEAAESYVDIIDLHEKAGRRIAQLLGCEAACITSGAAAGIAISAAAVMAGDNEAKIMQLPDTAGMKNEAIMIKCHRILYDQALLLSGIKIKEVGAASFTSIDQIEQAITDNTALFFFVSEAEQMRGSVPIKDIIRVMHSREIPVVVDAAAEIPPKSNIIKYLELGADLVLFSGGKEIRGPQSSGLILGREELIRACNKNCCPNYSIGRSMKTDKETIAGITMAVQIFAEKDYEKEMEKWDCMVNTMIEHLKDNDRMIIRKGFPIEQGVQPICIPRMYIRPLKISTKELYDRLVSMDPQVYTNLVGEEIEVNPQCLENDELHPLITAIELNIK